MDFTSPDRCASGVAEATPAGVQIITAPTEADQTAYLTEFTSTDKGLAPASGGGTTKYLRADGTWATPPGGGGGSGNSYFPGGW